jgi:alginate O-acetyltransferase complex protein AlgI
LVTFALCGLWHGAGWNFVVWGLWHGTAVALERVGLFRRWDGVGPAPRHGRVVLTVMLGWVLFRCPTLAHGVGYWGALLGGGPMPATAFLNRELLILLPAGVLACLPPPRWRWRPVRAWRPALGATALALLFAGALTAAVAGAYRPFIYFRF